MQGIIEELKKTPLTSYSTDRITQLLNGIGKIAFMITDYDYPKTFERAVSNSTQEPIFKTKDRISISPPKYNITYKRANTPNNTMFYAAVIPEDIDDDEIKNARITAASETCDLLRSNELDKGESIITFGKWIVKERISLVTIIDLEKTYRIKYFNELLQKYRLNLSGENLEVAVKTRDYIQFLSYEFSKNVEYKKEFEYMISAIFTETLLRSNNRKIDGVLYPSVMTGSDGLCVAIHPKSLNKIELIQVIQSRITKSNGQAKIENIRFCEVKPPNSNFELLDL